jgi:hypothetical protein
MHLIGQFLSYASLQGRNRIDEPHQCTNFMKSDGAKLQLLVFTLFIGLTLTPKLITRRMPVMGDTSGSSVVSDLRLLLEPAHKQRVSSRQEDFQSQQIFLDTEHFNLCRQILRN